MKELLLLPLTTDWDMASGDKAVSYKPIPIECANDTAKAFILP